MMQKTKGDGDAAMNEQEECRKAGGKFHEFFLFSLVLDSDCSAGSRGNKI